MIARARARVWLIQFRLAKAADISVSYPITIAEHREPFSNVSGS